MTFIKNSGLDGISATVARILLACLVCWNWNGRCLAQAPVEHSKPPERWAVILVGLPGDANHAAQFDQTADVLQIWLTETLEYPMDHVVRLPSRAADAGHQLSADRVGTMLAEVKQKLQAEDSLWVLLLGHGNYDGKRAWIHLAGRDPSSDDVGRWLDDLRCREQVIWLTHSSSGWFIKPLSRAGRIVVAATATDDESNETEFPHALATVCRWPIAKLDHDKNKVVTVDELFATVVGEVLRRFQSDNRLPTEHAQLDDNGDGVGTEQIPQKPMEDPQTPPPANSPTMPDGELARKTVVPYRNIQANSPPSPQ